MLVPKVSREKLVTGERLLEGFEKGHRLVLYCDSLNMIDQNIVGSGEESHVSH